MIISAADLDHCHLGMAVAYGPALMFSGVIEHISHYDEPWLQGDELAPVPAPPRCQIRTTDGRWATLAHDVLVHLKEGDDD